MVLFAASTYTHKEEYPFLYPIVLAHTVFRYLQISQIWECNWVEDWPTLSHGKTKHLHDLREQLHHLIPDVSGVLTQPEWLAPINLTLGHHLCEIHIIKSFQKPCAQPNQKIKPPLFSIMTILLRSSLRETFCSTRTCENSSLEQNYVWGTTTEEQPLFSSLKRKEWDSVEKTAMLHIRMEIKTCCSEQN